MKHLYLWAACALVALGAGCDEKLSSITGPTPDLAPNFAAIQRTIFSVTDSSGRLACVGCHSDQGRTPASNLVLIEGRAYQQLVGRASLGKPGATLVIPGDPDNSYIVKKLEGLPISPGCACLETTARSYPKGRCWSFGNGSRTEPKTIEVTVTHKLRYAFGIFALILAVAVPATAQEDDPDFDVNYAQPDFTLASLPTNLRLPKYQSAFRITHRFVRPLGDGSFGDLAGDLFGLDIGAQIGLEYRFGIMRRTQVGILRTSDRTIQFLGQREVKAQTDRFPVTISALATIDGTNNFRDSYTPALGAVISRTFREHVALYLEPMWVNNSNLLPSEIVDKNDTVLVGLGARLRIRPSVYIALEGVPRVSGFDPDSTLMSFGLEKRAGGNMFQLTVTNGFGTTIGQIARGARNTDDWRLGFSISRKFYRAPASSSAPPRS